MTVDKKHITLAKRQNDAMRRRYSTQASKHYYKIGQLKSLNGFIYVLIWAYFILAAIYLGRMFVGEDANTYSFFYKMAVLIVLVIFPYVITPIEMFFFRMIAFILEFIVGNIFHRPDYEYVIDYSYIPRIFSY